MKIGWLDMYTNPKSITILWTYRMSDKNYSKRELDHYFHDIRENIKEILIDGKETKMQTIETNGSIKEHKLYFKIIWVLVGALWALFLVVVPYVIKFIKQVNQLQTVVSNLTTNYEINND